MDEILTEQEVMKITKKSRSTLWRHDNDPESDFPARRKIGPGSSVGYLRSEIEEWMNSLDEVNNQE